MLFRSDPFVISCHGLYGPNADARELLSTFVPTALKKPQGTINEQPVLSKTKQNAIICASKGTIRRVVCDVECK
jgi:hypothetical protein